MTTLPTGTVTFLFTDVEGSTRLWEEKGEAMTDASAFHDEIIRAAVASNHGHVFSTAGDSFAAAFHRPVDGLEAALAAQIALAESGWPSGLRLNVRMALHSGIATERDGDYFGSTLNRASRLLSLGSGGQILLTEAIHGMVKDSPPEEVTFRDQGTHRLKDLTANERVFTVEHPKLFSNRVVGRSLDSQLHNLPLQATAFIGRDQEMSEAVKLLNGSRLLTITGVGGSGKTRLALQVATSVLDGYRDGVWLVELAPVTDPEGMFRTIAGSLGLREETGVPLEQTITAHLASRHLLLILDNCEHLLGAAAKFADRLLANAQQLTVLATSREMLGIAGETPYQLRSMSVPDPDDPPELAGRFDSVRLFGARAEAVRAGFRVNSENVRAVASLCHRLDGMPLAIELAAARLRILSPEQIAARLDDRFRLLTGGSRTALPRQQTLQAAIDWSYDLLSPDEKTLFNRLSVFQGGFTLDAAEEVCGADPLQPARVLDLLGYLVDKSLVLVLPSEDEPRYRLLETLRQYSRERLAEMGEVEEVRFAHAEYFLRLAEKAFPSLRGPDEKVWLDRLTNEHDNLRQALRWAIDVRNGAVAQGIAGNLYRFWMMRHHSEEGRAWLKEALDLPPGGEAIGLAWLGAGTLALLHGDLAIGRIQLEQALEALGPGSRTDLILAAVHNLGLVLTDLGEYEEAEARVNEELTVADANGDWASMAFGRQQLAALMYARGQIEDGHLQTESAIEYATKLGSKEMLGNVLITALTECLTLDDIDLADSYAQQLVELGQIDSAPGRHVVAIALVQGRRGQAEEAVRTLRDNFFVNIRKFADVRSNHLFLSGLLSEQAEFELALGFGQRAAVLLGASEQLLRGARRMAHEEAAFERKRAMVLAHVSAIEYAEAFERGRSMPFDDLLEFAAG